MNYYLKRFTFWCVIFSISASVVLVVLAQFFQFSNSIATIAYVSLLIAIDNMIIQDYRMRQADLNVPIWRTKFIIYTTLIAVAVQMIPAIVVIAYAKYQLHQFNVTVANLTDPAAIAQAAKMKAELFKQSPSIRLINASWTLILSLCVGIGFLFTYIIQLIGLRKKKFTRIKKAPKQQATSLTNSNS